VKGVDGSYSDILIKDMIEWPIMLVETEQAFYDNEEIVTIAINALATKEAVDNYNVEVALDLLVKPILSADLVKYAYPIKYHNFDNPA
jgi:hypothetical protein